MCLGYTRTDIEASLDSAKYDDVFATYLLLGRKSTDVCIEKVLSFFLLILNKIILQPESDGSRSGSSLSLRNISGQPVSGAPAPTAQSPSHRGVHRSISATNAKPSRRASSGGETLRAGAPAQAPTSAAAQVAQTNNHQQGYGFKRQNTVDSATIKENSQKMNVRPASAQPKIQTPNADSSKLMFCCQINKLQKSYIIISENTHVLYQINKIKLFITNYFHYLLCFYLYLSILKCIIKVYHKCFK